MALSDFLTEGAQIPSGSAVKSITSQTVLPDWYSNYAMDVLAGQKALSAQPYQTYQGPRIADFNPVQQAGFNQTMGAAGAYQPALNAATQATQGAMGRSSLGAAEPLFGQARSINPSGLGAPDFGASRSMLGQATGINPGAAAAGYYGGALGLNPSGAAAGDYNAAGNAIGQSQGYDSVGAAQPWYGQAAGMSALGSAQPYFGEAGGMSSLGSAQPYYGAATSMDALSTAQPYLSGGANYALAATQGSGLDAAMPWLQASSGNVANVGEYFNPYQDAVVSRIADLGTRNLRDNIMPALEGRYIGTGQFRGSGQMTDTMRAVRDTSDDILGQQSLALQQGYNQAQQAKLSDLGRYGQLGATAGDLASRQQQVIANAGRTLADIGATAGGFTQGQQKLLADIGTSSGGMTQAQQKLLADMGIASGNMTQGQQQLLAGMGTNLGELTQGQQRGALDAAGALSNLGTSKAALTQNQQKLLTDIGASMGGFAQGQQKVGLDAASQYAGLGGQQAALGQQQQQFLANLGISSADIYGRDTANQMSGAAQLANMGGLAQKYGLDAGAAMTGVGDRGQALSQGNLDTAYADFLRQQGYPQQQIDAMLNTFKGIAPGVPTATKEYGIVPTGQAAEYKPSTASQIASGLTGVAGIADLLKGIF